MVEHWIAKYHLSLKAQGRIPSYRQNLTSKWGTNRGLRTTRRSLLHLTAA